ncbi:uncharacterized protein LOC109535513 isoform X2 [Dendroctonus ponderosae]|uniref:uncharacterized protein LOC109535513 isoform X2 n=1 Tax=Dendroctonus ponderosae TaxID=77166 RepID=UPI002035982A|nr:uncharacterized protein LOC109535513 isoform X2 [Dendroctonus ponderosae]
MSICFSVLITLAVVSVSLCQPPAYSESYAKVRFQTQWKTSDGNKALLKAEETHKEEENSRVVSDAESISLAEHQELTTERESEQINFAGMQRGQLLKDKLQHDDEGKKKSLATIAPDSDAKIIENLDEVEYELEDLNNQGVYYIIHPSGLFQKVVYSTWDDPQYMQSSTQINNADVDPIMEPVYTYDPTTFVFQRFILGLPQ